MSRTLIGLALLTAVALVACTPGHQPTPSTAAAGDECPERFNADCQEPVVFRFQGDIFAMDYLEWREARYNTPDGLMPVIQLPDGRLLDFRIWQQSDPLGIDHDTPTLPTAPKHRQVVTTWPHRLSE